MNAEHSSRRGIESLTRLNQLAHKNAWTLEDLDWSMPIDRERLWAPPEMSPLSYLPSYARLSEEQQRRYNQIFALAICEQFIWFETNFLVDAMESVVRQFDVPEELVTAVNFLTEEEIKHTRMFWRLLEKCQPDWYPRREYHIFKMTPMQRLLTKSMLRWPRHVLVWIWIAIFFEERTGDYCRQYLRYERRNPGAIDPAFLQVHRFHFRDEARHFQLDQHLLDWIYDRAPRWKCRLAGKMFYRVMRGYTSPRNTARQTLRQLGREFPELERDVIPALERELPLLGKSKEYHQMAFSRKSVGNSLALFAEYPELDRLWPLFQVETKADNLRRA